MPPKLLSLSLFTSPVRLHSSSFFQNLSELKNSCCVMGFRAIAFLVLLLLSSTVSAQESEVQNERRESGRSLDLGRRSKNWIKSEDVQNIEYFPTIEEMEFYELCEHDYAKEKAAEQLAKKAACRAKKSKMAAGTSVEAS